jgi:hypothetical protein
MCPWCWLCPVCPCRHSSAPRAFWLSRAIVAAIRRLATLSPSSGMDAVSSGDRVIMRPRWWALPVTALGCLVFVAMGVALVAVGGPAGIVIGAVSIAFFGGGLVLLVLRRPWRWAIVIDDRGVTWRRPAGDTVVRWGNIAGVSVTRMGGFGGQTFVTLKLLDPSALDQPALGRLNRPLQGLNRRLAGGEASIGWNERDRPAEEVADLLLRRLEAFGARG